MEQVVINDTEKAQNLKKAWEELKATNPKLRVRDIADELKVSEAELLASDCGNTVTRLEANWPEFITHLASLGHIMALTRNESCVMEHKGAFENVKAFGMMAQSIGPIETRMLLANWKVGFAVNTPTEKGTQQSIQIFDKSGNAILKLFLQPESNVAAYDSLVETFKSPNQASNQDVTPHEERPYQDNVDLVAFKNDWESLKDTHDFFKLLAKHGLYRLKALELIGSAYAYQINPSEIHTVLEQAVSQHIPIMVFVENVGNIQIHIGPIQNVKVLGEWLNILDPAFNLHLKETNVDTMWVVKRPSADGFITGVELYDKNKKLVAQLFGERKPGSAELETWRNLVTGLKVRGN